MTTYEVIEHIDLPSGASSNITFSNIPSDYEDLIIKASLRSTQSGADVSQLRLSFNGSTSSFTKNFIQGNGAGGVNAYGGTDSQCGYIPATSATASTFGNVFIHIVKYTASENKSFTAQVVSENSGATAFQVSHSGYWANSSAITSIGLSALSANLSQYSSATLYGVRKYATSTKTPKATGGIISFDSLNNYWVHTFTASGTFTPTENLTCEYLVIAGGGGGGGNQGGGGGAGGYRSSVSGELSGRGAPAESPLSLTASTGYTVTVGAGGVGPNGPYNGAVGNNSVFASITSDGGGYGATYTTPGGTSTGGNGGSGGGAGAGADAKTHPGGSGTAGQGFDGGDSPGSSGDHRAGGGGGAGQAGGDGAGGSNVWIGGDGGDGIASSITGTSIIRAGGGGGAVEYTSDFAGAGGAGGGGAGGEGSALLPESGLPATGGGGGGCGTPGGGQAGSGGSGVVIVRYAA